MWVESNRTSRAAVDEILQVAGVPGDADVGWLVVGNAGLEVGPLEFTFRCGDSVVDTVIPVGDQEVGGWESVVAAIPKEPYFDASVAFDSSDIKADFLTSENGWVTPTSVWGRWRRCHLYRCETSRSRAYR